MINLPLFTFKGATFDNDRDGPRLGQQLTDVREFMRNGAWWTLDEITIATGHPQASVSARLRDLRRSENGGYIVERQYVARGLHKYRVKEARHG